MVNYSERPTEEEKNKECGPEDLAKAKMVVLGVFAAGVWSVCLAALDHLTIHQNTPPNKKINVSVMCLAHCLVIHQLFRAGKQSSRQPFSSLYSDRSQLPTALQNIQSKLALSFANRKHSENNAVSRAVAGPNAKTSITSADKVGCEDTSVVTIVTP